MYAVQIWSYETENVETLYCESGNVFKYHGNYCTDFNEESLTTNIVEELLTKCQIVI